MHLKNLQIVNYRNLRNCSISLKDGINTIIGENDSGKSNSINALRMLMDESYYISTKSLKESDFSASLNNWRGHWIIISGELAEISTQDCFTESISEICISKESAMIVESQIGTNNNGFVTLFIRPDRKTRTELSQANNTDQFNEIRKSITVYDYEIYYTARSEANFNNSEIYKKIVGDLDGGVCVCPDEDDHSILGSPLVDIRSFQSHISVVTIDALRDVESELKKGRNPIKRMIESIQSNITDDNKEMVSRGINNLNEILSNIEQIKDISNSINSNLLQMIGSVYSPNLKIQSQMNSEISHLSRYMSLKSSDFDDINTLGLGHLNMIYISLKLVEFEVLRSRELLNIMLIEEPEAHIHNHIQRTLFNNMSVNKEYTQVIMTTHSVHISEVSQISRLNIMKAHSNQAIAMQPSNGLDEFGRTNLGLDRMSLTKAVERYLDVKRSVLVFSKGVLLVEGDGEEILIPNLLKEVLGISLDELGIGIINIGSVAFEYIASLFSNERIRKHCAILTDSDKQAVLQSSKFHKPNAEHLGKGRMEKLERLYGRNDWVKTFYSEYTFEVDFIDTISNVKYVKNVVDVALKSDTKIKEYKDKLDSDSLETRAESVLHLANKMGKGWYATLLSEKLDSLVHIPGYISDALLFVASDVITEKVILKIIKYVLDSQEENNVFNLLRVKIQEIENEFDENKYKEVTSDFISLFKSYSAAVFVDNYLKLKNSDDILWNI